MEVESGRGIFSQIRECRLLQGPGKGNQLGRRKDGFGFSG